MVSRGAVLLTALALVAGGCLPGSGSNPRARPKLLPELLVSAEQLAERLDDPQLVILHVARDRAGYDAGHLPGARFLALSALVVERDGIPNELPPVSRLDSVFESVGVGDASRVVLYGDLGGLSAARAFFTLDYLGHADKAVLDGGLEVWRAEERPISRDVPASVRGMLNPQPRPEIVVGAEWVLERLDSARVVLIDARPPEQYTGATPGDGITRPGHIRGAHNLYWKNTLLSEQRPVLRTPDVLRGMFELADADRRDTVVTYCRTGVQASWDYFVARYLGYTTRMYDASYLDWSRRGAGFPVVAGDSIGGDTPRTEGARSDTARADTARSRSGPGG
jgi:thiosulfate/3-mercaptopyruvate sulfurtransferase